MTDAQRPEQLLGPLLTVGEVAASLRVSDMTIYRLIRAGQLPALRVGAHYRIRAQELAAFVADGIVHADESNG